MFFSHLPPDEAKYWATQLRPQPPITTPLTNLSYLTVPCAYLYCTEDKAIPYSVQQMMEKSIEDGGGTVKVYSCPSGHAPALGFTSDVADALEDFASGL